VHDVAALNLQPSDLAAMPLEGDIMQLLILNFIGAFDLYNVPIILAHRIKDIHPAVKSVTGKTSFEQRFAEWETSSCFLEVLPDVFSVQVNAILVQLVRQLADQMSLVKYALGGSIHPRQSFWIIGRHPQQLEALYAINVFGFRQIPLVIQ
jgi:hypothetical protein